MSETPLSSLSLSFIIPLTTIRYQLDVVLSVQTNFDEAWHMSPQPVVYPRGFKIQCVCIAIDFSTFTVVVSHTTIPVVSIVLQK